MEGGRGENMICFILQQQQTPWIMAVGKTMEWLFFIENKFAY